MKEEQIKFLQEKTEELGEHFDNVLISVEFKDASDPLTHSTAHRFGGSFMASRGLASDYLENTKTSELI